MTRSRPILEVCIAGPADAIAAEAGGADRLEMNAGPALGGLSPSVGLWEITRRSTGLPMIALVRPRPGGFDYDANEFLACLEDIRFFRDRGAAGLAVGVLDEEGEIDVERAGVLREAIGSAEAVFHRAFDVTSDLFRALDMLIALGYTRVLTSGGRPNVEEGAEVIERLVKHAAGRIEILPGGGVRAENVVALVDRTGCGQIHGSFRRPAVDRSTMHRPEVRFGAPGLPEEWRIDVTSEQTVRAVRRALDEAASSS